jgi:hypothetical protein
MRHSSQTDLEDIECCTGVQTRLLIAGVQDGGFCAFVGGQGGRKIKFETLDNEVVEFDLVAEDIGGGPCLCQGESVDFVSPLSFNVAIYSIRLGVTNSLDLEGNIGRRLCLDFKGCSIEWIILGEQVIR